jgi:hypothetical protein
MGEGWPENAALAELRLDGDEVTVVRDGEPLHDPVERHDDTHPAGRDGDSAGAGEGDVTTDHSTGEAVADRVRSESEGR